MHWNFATGMALTRGRAWRRARGATAIARVTAGALVAGMSFAATADAHAAGQALTVAISTTDGTAVSSAQGGDELILTTTMPVSNLVDTVTQEMIQEIDPSKIRLTGPGDVVVPNGWSAEYSTDGTTFSSTPSSWGAVVKVRSRGVLNSAGSTQDGKQIDIGSTVIKAPPVIRVPAAASSGDGYDVTFDDRGYLFNMYHHDSPVALDCHVRATAASCPGSWPFYLGNGLHTNNNSTSYVDNVNNHVWFPNNTTNSVGFGCVDVSDISRPKFCGGSFATGYKPLSNSGSWNHSAAAQIVGVGNFVFSWNTLTGKLLCYNIMANNGLGAPCATPVPNVSSVPANANSDFYYDLAADGSAVYGFHYTSGVAVCFNSTTMGKCPGWSSFEVNLGSGVNSSGKDGWGVGGMYFLPDSQGDILGVCFAPQRKCVRSDGTVVAALNTDVANAMDVVSYSQTPVTIGTKLLWMNSRFNAAKCFDVATNTWCTNWGAGGIAHSFGYGGYTVTLDPENSNCVWTNSDDGRIRSYDVLTAQLGCTSPPTRVAFKNNLVPFRTCDGSESVQRWSKFRLTGIPEADYTSATLTIRKTSGELLVSGGTTWYKVPIPKDGERLVDISSIDVADSGVEPDFIIDFVGRTTTADVSAELTVVGGTPQMCVAVKVQYNCSSSLGPMSPLAGWTATFEATGFAVDSANVSTPMTPDRAELSVAAPTADQCGARIRGVARDLSPSAGAIAGVTVSLLDSSGNAVMYPADYQTVALRGTAVTTTTAADGSYEFPHLYSGSYTVSFPSREGSDVYDSSVVSGAPGTAVGTNSATDSTAVSRAAVVAPGTSAVVNARYINLADAEDDSAVTGSQMPVQLTLLANDKFGSGQAWDLPAIFLCPIVGAGAVYDDTSCTLQPTEASAFATADGRYVLNPATGVLTFTPTESFYGVVTEPVHYVVRDTHGTWVSAKAVISVIGAVDRSQGWTGEEQLLRVLDNDTRDGQGGTDPSSVRLCDPNLAEVVPNCTATSVSVESVGTYEVLDNGVVKFIPAKGFSGEAPELKYQVAGGRSGIGGASIFITVEDPVPPEADPDTEEVPTGGSVTLNLLGNDRATGTTLVPSSLRLCGPRQTAPNCTETSITTDAGTFTLNLKTGKVTFSARKGFRGVVRLPYQVLDSLGQVASSTLTLRVGDLPRTGSNTNLHILLVAAMLGCGLALRRRWT